MKKMILPILIVSLLIFGLFGCAPVEEAPKTSGKLLKVAKYYWPGQFWIEIADEKGWFAEAGLNVELIDTNSDWEGSLTDMANGKMDVNQFSLFGFLANIVKGFDLVMVINADTSFGAEAIVTKKEIERVADLKGKTIGVDYGSYTEYILDLVLSRNSLSNNDVQKVDMLGENAAEKFSDEEIDAVITWEPIVTEILNQGGRKLFDTSEIPGISPNGIVFHKSFINEHPDDVQAFVNVWHRTTEFIKTNPKEAFQIIADNYNVPVGDVQAFTQDVKILDLRENKIAFSYAAGFESLHGTARQINDFMIDKGITDKQLDSTDFIDARFIRGVEE
jgi:NitT/TauT family transport system substrate-binding protein